MKYVASTAAELDSFMKAGHAEAAPTVPWHILLGRPDMVGADGFHCLVTDAEKAEIKARVVKFPIKRDKQKVEKVKVVKQPKAPKEKGESKRDIATRLYLANKDLPQKQMVELLVKEMEISASNAATYIYNVKKALLSE